MRLFRPLAIAGLVVSMLALGLSGCAGYRGDKIVRTLI